MKLTNLYEKKKKEKQRKLKIQTAKKILVGTAAGSITGLIGGLLFSPKSGKETRQDIANSSKEFSNNIKYKATEVKGTVDNKIAETKNNVSDAKSKISEYLNEKKASRTTSDTKEVIIDTEDVLAPVTEDCNISKEECEN